MVQPIPSPGPSVPSDTNTQPPPATKTTKNNQKQNRSLTDSSPYVRKTGVMGILKLFHLAPELVQGSNMVDLLYNMIQDPDVHVRALVSLVWLIGGKG